MRIDELCDLPFDAWIALAWFEQLHPGEDHGGLPPYVSLWWQFLFDIGLIEHGVGLAMFRLSGNGRLALHLHRQATVTANPPKRSRSALAMPSAARESAGSDESPKPQAYPVHVESLSDGVAQLLGRKTDNPVSLDDEQRSTASSSPTVSQAAELDRAGTLADAAPSQASDLQFIPSELQERILEVLDQKALTLDALGLKLQVDRSTLHRNGIKELRQRGLICNHRRVGGYYRPDAPPPQYADKLGKTSR